jgi:acetyl-CoA carboxylase biotin carboxylase subunit
MNARIQVEHGVTELITGVDLVREQLRVAAGEKLDLRPRDGRLEGWAVQCRIVAEDPRKDFRPSPGQVVKLQVPSGSWVRWDSDLHAASKVTPMFDSLIGKLLVWGRDRAEAIARMRRALSELVIEGVSTSAPLMRAIMEDPDFCAGKTSVRYLEARLGTLLNGNTST